MVNIRTRVAIEKDGEKMKKRDRLICLAANIVSGLIIAVLLFFLRDYKVDKIAIIAHYLVAIAIIVCAVLATIIKNDLLMKITLLASIFAIIFASLYDTLVFTGLIEQFLTEDGFQNFLKNYDEQAMLVFMLIQFLQVTILPLPSALTIAAGTALFGVVNSVVISSIGIILGSMFAFFLGKVFGRNLAVWLCGEKNVIKYQEITKGKDKILFFLMFLLPFFPDDLLCVLAGMTGMSYMAFFIMMLATRPIGALTVAGSFKGITSIPFKGWGVFVWIALICAFVVGVALLLKYSSQIQSFFEKMAAKLNLMLKHLMMKISKKYRNKVEAQQKENKELELSASSNNSDSETTVDNVDAKSTSSLNADENIDLVKQKIINEKAKDGKEDIDYKTK